MCDAGMKVPSIVNLQYVVPATIIVYIGNMKKKTTKNTSFSLIYLQIIAIMKSESQKKSKAKR